MRKIYALIFVISYIAVTVSVHAATSNFDFDGVKLQCEKRNDLSLRCKDGKKDYFVLVHGDQYIVYDKINPPSVKFPKRVFENGKIKYISNEDRVSADTQEQRRLLAGAVLDGTYGLDDDYSKAVLAEARSYLAKTPEFLDKVKVVLNANETLSCTRSTTKPTQESGGLQTVCSHFSCTGNDPKEKVLFYMPPIGSTLVGPSVLAMKDGQARFYDDNFKILDESNSVVSMVRKGAYYGHDYTPMESKIPVDADLLIPSKYNDSKTSYEYLQQFAANSGNDTFGTRSLCSGAEVNKLFDQQKKIAEEMKEYRAYADIVAYLSSVNGDVRSIYVDKEKAMNIGCSFQDKILDYNVLPELQRLEKLADSKPQDKYPSEKDVQKIFKKAQSMSDIPFGYKYDGCYARAHIMARRFEKMGMKVKKAWIKGELHVPGTDITWGYHVAPLIEAKDKKGNIVQYVLDPSLTDKAVTLDEWVATMEKKSSKSVMKTTYPIAENGLDFQRTVVAVSSSDPYAPVDMKGLTEEDKMQNAKEVLAEYTEVLKSLKK